MRYPSLLLSGLLALSGGCKATKPPPFPGVVVLDVGRIEILPFGPTRILTLPIGTSATLATLVLDTRGEPYDPTPTVTFTAQDSSVARVSKAGVVTALRPGSTFVKALVVDVYWIYPDSIEVSVVVPGALK